MIDIFNKMKEKLSTFDNFKENILNHLSTNSFPIIYQGILAALNNGRRVTTIDRCATGMGFDLADESSVLLLEEV